MYQLGRPARVGAHRKLDLALTRGIDVDPVRRALAAALFGFANEIGATLVAEGIESAAELQVLRTLGVRWGQGFFLARPAPLTALDLGGIR
jgi:EAL domain-containing protein (putative c-di-GMP-specific phosphodiesterase class I)